MSVGVPGYDYDVNEQVTAEKLRRWLERATWSDLSYSETSGELVGMRVQNAQPSDTSEGLFWYRPDMQKMHVYTRRGWVGIFNPMSWETIRLKNFSAYGGAKARVHRIYNAGSASVTAGAVTVNIGSVGVCNAIGLDTKVSGQTLAANEFFPMVCGGLCGAAADVPIGAQLVQYLVKPNVSGQVNTPVTTSSLPSNALHADGVGVDLDVTLSPPIYAYYPLYFFGFPIHFYRADGL